MATLGLGGRSPRRFCRGKLPVFGVPGSGRLEDDDSAVSRGVMTVVVVGSTAGAAAGKANFCS
jgi:hypothetical protein